MNTMLQDLKIKSINEKLFHQSIYYITIIYIKMMACNMFRSLWHHLQCVRKSCNTLHDDDDPITVKIY
jgi:hypothetical protein